jgi:hypothetical protein
MKFFTPIALVIIGASVALGADAVPAVSLSTFRWCRSNSNPASMYIWLISVEMLVYLLTIFQRRLIDCDLFVSWYLLKRKLDGKSSKAPSVKSTKAPRVNVKSTKAPKRA